MDRRETRGPSNRAWGSRGDWSACVRWSGVTTPTPCLSLNPRDARNRTAIATIRIRTRSSARRWTWRPNPDSTRDRAGALTGGSTGGAAQTRRADDTSVYWRNEPERFELAARLWSTRRSACIDLMNAMMRKHRPDFAFAARTVLPRRPQVDVPGGFPGATIRQYGRPHDDPHRHGDRRAGVEPTHPRRPAMAARGDSDQHWRRSPVAAS